MEIDQHRIKELRRRGHNLKPVVLTGAAGLSNAVLEEIERALTDHELVKIKLAGADKEQRREMTAEIVAATGAVAVQNIGRIVLLFRDNPQQA